MKRIFLFISLSLVSLSYCMAQEDNSTKISAEEYFSTAEPEIVFDNESPFKDIFLPSPQVRSKDNIIWTKTVWRLIDLREQFNFPLYYPTQESNGRKNLFSTIFDLVLEQNITPYKYTEDKEDFTEGSVLNLEKVIENAQLTDATEISQNEAGDSIFTVNPIDIPSDMVYKFYIKEVWYYDALESCMKFKIISIAPLLDYTDIDGNNQTTVLFWIDFDELRPFLAKQPVVINNKNSMASISYDDLFQKRRFIGHIYKEDNIQNRSILQYCDTPEEVRREQQRIENEILNFEFDLWEF